MLRKQSELYPAPNTYVSGEWNITYTYNEDQKPELHIDMENQSNINVISTGALSDVTDSGYTLTDSSDLEEGMVSLLTNATSLSSVGDRVGVWCSFEFDSPETLSNVGFLSYSHVGFYSDIVEQLFGMSIPLTSAFNQISMGQREGDEDAYALVYQLLTDPMSGDGAEGIIENWDPTTESVATVMDFNTNMMEFWVSRDGGTKIGETDLLKIQDLLRLEFEDPSLDLIGGFDKVAVVIGGEGKRDPNDSTGNWDLPNGIRIKTNKTFDIPDVISLFDSSSGYVIDDTVMPDTNPSNRAYVVKTPVPFTSTHLGDLINDGDIVAFGSKGEPVLALKKDPDANIFTGSEKTKLSALPSNQTLTAAFNNKVDKQSGRGLIEPAPYNNKQYARRNNAWVEVTGDVEEAPFDGKQYARRNNAWVEINLPAPLEWYTARVGATSEFSTISAAIQHLETLKTSKRSTGAPTLLQLTIEADYQGGSETLNNVDFSEFSLIVSGRTLNGSLTLNNCRNFPMNFNATGSIHLNASDITINARNTEVLEISGGLHADALSKINVTGTGTLKIVGNSFVPSNLSGSSNILFDKGSSSANTLQVQSDFQNKNRSTKIEGYSKVMVQMGVYFRVKSLETVGSTQLDLQVLDNSTVIVGDPLPPYVTPSQALNVFTSNGIIRN